MKGNEIMKVTLVRHGLTDYNQNRRIQGFSDIPLNATGIEQAESARDFLSEETFDAIYSSPLVRAYKTAEIINEKHALDIVTHDKLKEQNFHAFEGWYVSEVIKKYPEGDLPGIERIEDLAVRAKEALDDIYNHMDYDAHVLITAHSRTIKAILHHFDSEIDIKMMPLENCSVSRIEYDGKDGKILEMNVETH